MGNIPVVSITGRGHRGCYRLDRPLPAFYMADYSVLGLMVDNPEEAVDVLRDADYPVSQGTSGFEVTIETPSDLERAVRLLSDRGIRFQIADLVAGIYQG